MRRIQYLATKTVGSEGLRRRGTTGGEDPVLGNQDYGRQPPKEPWRRGTTGGDDGVSGNEDDI